MLRLRLGIIVARALEAVAKAARAFKRAAGAPRRALLKPLAGLPIRLDVINKACTKRRGDIRNVYSHRNPLRLAIDALAGGAARRERVAKTIGEQPVCESLVYLLTFAGGAKRIRRDPKAYLAGPHSDPPACGKGGQETKRPRGRKEESAPGVCGVRRSRVLGAFAGDQDVTRLVEKIGHDLKDLNFEDVRHYLVSACGVDGEFQTITIVFANLEKRVMRAEPATTSS